jgi:L-ascorbate metabolism protein UlaG (beta-lactamase superfamily)
MDYKITWLGHAALQLEIGSTTLLVDPYFPNPTASYSNPDTITADYILVTHGHGDHIGKAVSIAKRCEATVICNAEIADWLKAKEVKVHGQHLGGGFTYPFGYLKLTMALHGSRLPDGTCGGNPAGFLLTLASGKKIYMAGDTGLFGDMRLIGEEGLDLAVIPIGDNYTMGPADALRAVKLLQPRVVIPIHYSTWELIAQDANTWAEQVRTQTKTEAIVLKPGESFQG